jgi:hypothetical protein
METQFISAQLEANFGLQHYRKRHIRWWRLTKPPQCPTATCLPYVM